MFQAIALGAVVAALAPLAALLEHLGWLGQAPGVVASVALQAGVLMATVALLLALAHQPVSTLGLSREPISSVLGFGAIGVVMAYAANIAAVLVYVLITRPDLEQLGRDKLQALDPLAAIPVAVLVPIAVVVGIYEEIAFRGLLLFRLRAALSSRLPARAADVSAILISSAIFAYGHGYQGLSGIVQTGAAGIAFSVLAIWRKSIWSCIVAHIAIDTFGLVMLRVLRPALESVTI